MTHASGKLSLPHNAGGPRLAMPPRPMMVWRSDSLEPHITTGTATWQAADGKPVGVRFESFADAHRVQGLLDAAWHSGHEHGRAELAAQVREAVRVVVPVGLDGRAA